MVENASDVVFSVVSGWGSVDGMDQLPLGEAMAGLVATGLVATGLVATGLVATGLAADVSADGNAQAPDPSSQQQGNG